MDRKYQIFISSTSKDLDVEREIAIEAVMKAGMIPAAMELFSATGEAPLEAIKPIIYDSDYYLLIIGGKYGTVEKSSQLSYTELEYDFAVEQGKRVIAFIHADPDNLPSHLRESSSSMRKRLQKFRTKAASGRLVRFWNTKEDLMKDIPASINTVVSTLPAKTCWIHVNEDVAYIPLQSYTGLADRFPLDTGLGEKCGVYATNLPQKLLSMNHELESNSLELSVDIPKIQKDDVLERFIGCYVRMSREERDWSQYVLNDYYLTLNCMVEAEQPVQFWIEIKSPACEMFKGIYEFGRGEPQVIRIGLKELLDDIEDWKRVKEISIVFRPGSTDTKAKLKFDSFKLERHS